MPVHVASNGPIEKIVSVAPGYRKMLIRRIETSSGIVARRYGRRDRPTPAAIAIATTTTSVATGPDQPRTPNATRAIARNATNFVVGLSARKNPVGGRVT
jgi:hypothetical protein